jgi:DNA modification methylase
MEIKLNSIFLGSYADYIPLIEDKSLDLVITDPPYWILLL